jgi:hypothetical protein
VLVFIARIKPCCAVAADFGVMREEENRRSLEALFPAAVALLSEKSMASKWHFVVENLILFIK